MQTLPPLPTVAPATPPATPAAAAVTQAPAASSGDAPRTPAAMAADFIAALQAALPSVKTAPARGAATTAVSKAARQLPEQAVDPTQTPSVEQTLRGLDRAQAVAAAPALPTLAVVAQKLAARKTTDASVVETTPDETTSDASSAAITPELISSLIAAMVPQAPTNGAATPATPATKATPAIPSDGAGGATPAARATPATPAIAAQPSRPQDAGSESAIAQALATVIEKSPDHAAAADALSAIVADANPGKSLQAAPAQELVAIATASAFAPPPIVTQSATDAAPAPAIQLHVPVPVDHPQWGQAVGEQIVMAVHQGKHSAELRLDPPNLGPVSVQIELNGSQAKVSFVAPVNATCDALSQSLPDLKSAFAAQGMTLAQANISQQQTNQQSWQGSASPSHPGSRGSEPAAEAVPIRIVTPRGIVDEYA